jgi:hypothetical protein
MQKLAGLITESQYDALSEINEESPEQIANTVSKNASKLESNPKLNAIADKIANDPKALAQLNKLMSSFDISITEGTTDITPENIKKIALAFAKKSETLNEEGVGDIGFWAGLVGGGVLANHIASAGDVITPMMQLLGQSPSHMGATVLGAVGGAILGVIGGLVYDKIKDNN